jgi:hypothetical protein
MVCDNTSNKLFFILREYTFINHTLDKLFKLSGTHLLQANTHK